MDNLAIARIFAEIGDLLEIKNENPFKIRAYRNAADTIAYLGTQLADLSPEHRRGIPGIGRDLAAKVAELLETGSARYHQDLLQEFPPTVLDLLRLQGVGPKTVALLYHGLGITSLEELQAAAQDGRIRALKGMGAKKEALILKALEERQRFAGRRLMAEAYDAAASVVAALRAQAPGAEILPVGSLRRGCESCGDIDILAAGASVSLMDAFIGYSLVERVLARGDTKSSVLIWGGFQADLRIVPRESLGAAMQYFTGSKAHNILLRDRAIQHGFKLNEYGLYRVDDNSLVAGQTEEGIYAALGLAWVPPELREGRGEIAAAESGALPRLISLGDLRGDLHMHTTTTDGRDDAEAMAHAAQAGGREYVAITEHSQALAMANGLDEVRALAHAGEIRALNERLAGITVLAGIECDIRADGTMDLADECLRQLDLVIASVHSAFNLEEDQMTARVVRALQNPHVDILAHPTGRLILKREGYALNLDRVFQAAADAGVAVEINSQVDRLDLRDTHARRARELGVKIVIDSDAHSAAALGNLRWGTLTARRAWLEPGDVLNTLPIDEFRAAIRRHRR